MNREENKNIEEIFSNYNLNKNVLSQYNSTQPSQNCDGQSLNLCVLIPQTLFKIQFTQHDFLKSCNEQQYQQSQRQTERFPIIDSAPDIAENNIKAIKKNLQTVYSEQAIKTQVPSKWVSQNKQEYEITNQQKKTQMKNFKNECEKSQQIKELEEKIMNIKISITVFGWKKVFSLLLMFCSSIYTYLWFLYAVGFINQSKEINVRVMNQNNLSDTYLVYIPVVLLTISYIIHSVSNFLLVRKLKKEGTISLRLVIYLKIQYISLDFFPMLLIIIYSTILDSFFKITGAVIYFAQLITQLYNIKQYQKYIDNKLLLQKIQIQQQIKNSVNEMTTSQNY
ncbi:hypothetical protein ABPG72_012187 [Tetrahymena utriculariae]